jgi:hypothetical protein
LIFSLLPKNAGLGHSRFVNAAKRYQTDTVGVLSAEAVSPVRLLFAMAWFNSVPVDWLARQMIQINVSQTYLYRLPMPQPSDAEILANTNYTTLVKNALLLTLAASWDDFAELASLFHVQKSDVPATAKAMDMLRAENDRCAASQV